MGSSAIVLAGGSSTRLGQDKGLLQLANKPLIGHVLNTIRGIAEETFLVVSSCAQAENYAKHVDSDVHVLIDSSEVHGPLVGTLTGLESSRTEYSLVVSCDVPFVSREVLSLLMELSTGKAAVIPRWPNGYIEPLQAVYCTKLAKKAAKDALDERRLRMQDMIDRLQGIRFVSTLVLQQIDPGLGTFFNVNTLLDLRKAEAMFLRPNARLSQFLNKR